MNIKLIRIIVFALVVLYQVPTFSANDGRIVLFGNKGSRSIRAATGEAMDALKTIDGKEVFGCFVGDPESVKKILTKVIANTNSSGSNPDLQLKTFEEREPASQPHPIKVEVFSNKLKSVYWGTQLDPC